MKQLSLIAPADTATGCGITANEIALRLPALVGCDIIRIGPNNCEWEIVCSNATVSPTAGKKTIYFVVGSPPKLREKSVSILNKCEAVIAHSQHCADGFLASGVNVPIYVVQLGFNTSAFTWEQFAERLAWVVNRLLVPPNEITVVFPVCPADAHLAIRHAEWLTRLVKRTSEGRWGYKAVIVKDMTLQPETLERFESLLLKCFRSVEVFTHPQPPDKVWPDAPNWVFQQTARHMRKAGNPWLWFEADCVLLTHDGWDRIQSAYSVCGKNFMGPIVQDAGHMNGCGVYPANTPRLAPRAMLCKNIAFDCEMKPDMIHDCHDARDLIQHIWTMRGENYAENSQGDAPSNISAGMAKRWLFKSAVMVHRIKDTSLTDMLITGLYKHG